MVENYKCVKNDNNRKKQGKHVKKIQGFFEWMKIKDIFTKE